MKCPYCGYKESKVIDSRPAEEGSSIRRRRECLSCAKRFTTYETVESLPMVVIKKDGSRQSFDKRKVLNGMIRACEKRPVPFEVLEQKADEIEQTLQNSLEREVSTEYIGELVMDKLRAVDEVAYVRFASVYRQFKDIDTFMKELNKLHFRQHQKLRFELRDTRAKFALVLLEGEAVRAGKQGFDLVELVVLQNDVEIRRVRVPAFVKRGEIIAHAVPVLRLRGVLQFVELRAPVCN